MIEEDDQRIMSPESEMNHTKATFKSNAFSTMDSNSTAMENLHKEDGGLYDVEDGFLAKLVNMNKRVKIYKKLFLMKEPFYDKETITKREHDIWKKASIEKERIITTAKKHERIKLQP